jgi:hypothetical protein
VSLPAAGNPIRCTMAGARIFAAYEMMSGERDRLDEVGSATR